MAVKKVVKKVAKKEAAAPAKAKNGNGNGGRGPREVPEGMISVGMLAEEAGIEAQSARVKLRASDIERPEGSWLWKAGSSGLKAARKVLGLS